MSLIKVGTASTVEEVVLRNTGKSSIADLEGKPYYRIDGLKEAAERIKKAVRNKEMIRVFGDYDADGIDASGILYLTIKSIGGNVSVRLPKRLSEGFGLSEKMIDEFDSGLAITVDNGIVAFDAIKKAKEKGLDVIVTDHHLMDESGELPCADIIIDPHIEGTADFEDYCGAGIAYRLAKELTDDATLLAKVSCLAAIGTIADVVPLVEENRQIVKEGLSNMVKYGKRTSGLYSILRAVEMDRIITERDVAFKIGPMINAAGRLFDDGAEVVFKALVYDGPFDESIGVKINSYNDLRKEKVKNGMDAVEKNIAMNCLHGDYPLVIYEPSIEEGIVGIIAGRLAEEKNVPVFVFTDAEEAGIYKGSGRSAVGVHLKDLLDKCSDALYKYGGHAEAAGLSVKACDLDQLIELLQGNIPEPNETSSVTDVYYDLSISASDIPAMIAEMKKFAPYGEGNPLPRFLINDFALSPRYSSYYKTMGANKEHIKLFGVGACAVGFNMTQQYFDMMEPKKLTIVGLLSENHFMGKTEVQIEITHMEECKSTVGKSLLAKMLEDAAKNRYE